MLCCANPLSIYRLTLNNDPQHRRQGRIQEFALRGRLLSPPLHSLSLPLEEGSPLNQLGGSGERWVRPRTNFVHSKAVRKPLVAIIFSILKCVFYNCHLSGLL